MKTPQEKLQNLISAINDLCDNPEKTEHLILFETELADKISENLREETSNGGIQYPTRKIEDAGNILFSFASFHTMGTTLHFASQDNYLDFLSSKIYNKK